jgi:hypothetical protein
MSLLCAGTIWRLNASVVCDSSCLTPSISRSSLFAVCSRSAPSLPQTRKPLSPCLRKSGPGDLYVGQPLNGVPKVTGAAHFKYEHPTRALGRAFLRVDYSYAGSSLDLANSPVFGRVRPSYVLI